MRARRDEVKRERERGGGLKKLFASSVGRVFVAFSESFGEIKEARRGETLAPVKLLIYKSFFALRAASERKKKKKKKPLAHVIKT